MLEKQNLWCLLSMHVIGTVLKQQTRDAHIVIECTFKAKNRHFVVCL